jgi:hypothetical protein
VIKPANKLMRRISKYLLYLILGTFLVGACSAQSGEFPTDTPTQKGAIDPTSTEQKAQGTEIPPTSTSLPPTDEISADQAQETGSKPPASKSEAQVVSVRVNGEPGNYSFSVEVSSPDEGCSQYADWWEVIGLDGSLIFRRILLHSHVNEQPFTRSGGPVSVEEGETVLVRVHMQPGGYSDQAMKGTPSQGFEPAVIDPGFADDLSKAPPLPEGCAF